MGIALGSEREAESDCKEGVFSGRQQWRFRDRQLLEAQTVAGSQTRVAGDVGAAFHVCNLTLSRVPSHTPH